MGKITLYLNLLMYGGLLYKRYKERGFDISCYIISIYTFVAIMGIYLGYHPMSNNKFLQANIFYLIYLFIAFYITLSPVSNCPKITRVKLIPPSPYAFKAFMIFVAVITLVRFPDLVSNISKNFMLMILDSSYLSGRYEELANSGTSGFSSGSYNIIAILGGMIDEVSVFLLMYYLTQTKRKKWITLILAIASIISPLGALVQARRGAMVFSILSFGAYYLLFKACFSDKIKIAIRRIVLVAVILITFGMALITISRFTKSYMDDDYATYSMVYYLGQPMHYFCETIDPNGCRWGDRTIPLFKSLLTDGAYSYSERISKYHDMKLGEEVFSTYFGEIILDFGPYLGFIFLLSLVWLLNVLGPRDRNKIQFFELIPIMMLINLLICGWTQSPFSDIGGNLHFIFLMLMYVYFRIRVYINYN